MTLAMLQIAAGICALLVRGQIAYAVPPLIGTLGSRSLGPVPWIVIVAALFLLVGHVVLTYTRFGRYVYMTGGNREAAEYSGVNVRMILSAVMIISAMCAGVAGMLGVAYFGSAQQNEFDTYLLDSISAVVVGGTSLFGGQGGIGNTIIGLFVLGVLNNGLDHINIDSFLKILIRGLILLVALVINVYAQRMRTGRQDRVRQGAIAYGDDDASLSAIPVKSQPPLSRGFTAATSQRRANSTTGTNQRQFDAPVLCPTLRGIVGSRRVCVAEPLRSDEIGLHALRNQILLHGISTLLRQFQVRGDTLPPNCRADRGIIGVTAHHEVVLLRRCQLLCKVGDDLLPLRTHLPASRRKQQVAVDRVLDRSLQSADLLLVGGNLRLKLLILRLKFLVVAFPDNASRKHVVDSSDTAMTRRLARLAIYPVPRFCLSR